MKPKTSALATSSSLYNCHVVWVEKHPVWSEYILHLPHSATLWEPIQTSGFASPFTLITLWYFVSFDTCWSLLACFSFTEQDVLCEQTFDQAIRRGIPKHPEASRLRKLYFFHLLPSSIFRLMNLVHPAKGARHISILSLVLPALLGCLAGSRLRPVQQNASRCQNPNFGAEFAGFGAEI